MILEARLVVLCAVALVRFWINAMIRSSCKLCEVLFGFSGVLSGTTYPWKKSVLLLGGDELGRGVAVKSWKKVLIDDSLQVKVFLLFLEMTIHNRQL